MPGLSNTHPLFDKYEDDYKTSDHCFEGQKAIKEAGIKYLPPLPSMILDGMDSTEQLGFKRWLAYRLRANFPDDFSEAIKNYLGLLHQKAATISVPDEMKPMLDLCTSQGESMLALLRRINELQLRHGRLGILLDLPSGKSMNTMPYIAVYPALSCRNWDDGTDELAQHNLNMVTLDESTYVKKDQFSWTWEERYRVLSLGELDKDDPVGTAVYRQGLFTGSDTFVESDMIIPLYKNTPLDQIPFQFINCTDITTEPEALPLQGVIDLCLSIYRSDADYRQTLFLQGQETLVVVGGVGALAGTEDGKEPTRVGAGARIDVNMGGDAKYVGISAEGLSEQRKAIETDKAEVVLKSGQLISTKQSSQESGEAMKTRIGARTANLIRIAFTGAAGLENILKICAKWMGADETKVVVKPNTEFAKSLFSGQEFVQLMSARNLGAPVSMLSIHNWLVDQGITNLSFEEEMMLVEQELKKWPLPVGATGDLNTSQQLQSTKKPTDATKPVPKQPDETL